MLDQVRVTRSLEMVRLTMLGAATTAIEKLLVSLRLGVPLSVTRTVTPGVVLASVAEELQVKSPVPGLMLAPVGAASRLKLSVWGGASGSEAEFVTMRVLPAWIARLAMGESVGGALTESVAGSLAGEPGGVADGGEVAAGVGGLDIGSGIAGAGGAGDVSAVELPLVVQRTGTRGCDGEGHVGARAHGLAGGLAGDERRIHDGQGRVGAGGVAGGVADEDGVTGGVSLRHAGQGQGGGGRAGDVAAVGEIGDAFLPLVTRGGLAVGGDGEGGGCSGHVGATGGVGNDDWPDEQACGAANGHTRAIGDRDRVIARVGCLDVVEGEGGGGRAHEVDAVQAPLVGQGVVGGGHSESDVGASVDGLTYQWRLN